MIICHIDLVPYYLSKGFIIFEKVYGVFVNKTDPVLNKISSYPLHDKDIFLDCKAEIK